MSIYFLGIIILLLTIFVSGILVYSRYKKNSGFFYLALSICTVSWFILYFISFDMNIGPEHILAIYRFQYSLSIIGFYSLFFFICFYAVDRKKTKKYDLPIFLCFLLFFLISNFTPYILTGVEYNDDIQSYSEIYGPFYSLFVFFYGVIIPILVYTSIKKTKKLGNLNRQRIYYIIFGFSIFVLLSLTTSVFIPYLNADSSQLYFERIFPFFVLPFVISVLYSSYKYDFSDSKIYIHSIFIYFVSIVLSIIWLFLFRALMGKFGSDLHDFWDISSSLTWFDVVLGITLFIFFHKFFRNFRTQDEVKNKHHELQEQLPFITNLERLNTYLKTYFKDTLMIKDVVVSTDIKRYPKLKKVFEKHGDINFLVNDFVFWEKNKHKAPLKKISKEVGEEDILIFPLRGTDDTLTGILFIGKKRLPDAYTTEEIQTFLNFSKFLSGHLKYLDIYRQIHDLNLSLDKKVDEKTIEYNNLISRQKEFIAYLGHEVRNPITNIIFLSSDIESSIEELKQDKMIKSILEDISILNNELVKIADLTKSIFSTEKMDLGKIKLYKKKINLYDFLSSEIRTMEKTFPDVQFLSELENIGEYDLDEVQFREVVHNLLTNALKYVSKKSGKIGVCLRKEKKNIFIEIHDNGTGLSENDIANIFEKYATGNNDSIGLGMGLYLCKRIVELHGGTIKATNSTKFRGACFIIKL